jgi:hypothetical protein
MDSPVARRHLETIMADPAQLLNDDEALGALLRAAMHDEAPPRHVTERALALRSRVGRAAQAASSALRRLVAVVVPAAQSGTAFAPAFGVRGAAAPGWQSLYRSDECEIDLRVTPGSDERWNLAGQLFGALPAERVVIDAAGTSSSAQIGPTREFFFSALAPGLYRLSVQAGDVEVVIPRIELGPSAPR